MQRAAGRDIGERMVQRLDLLFGLPRKSASLGSR
jgi:hypothetical protein